MGSPIKPNDIRLSEINRIPEKVTEAINQLILNNWNGREAIVTQKEAAAAVSLAMHITIDEVYSKKYLDIEETYRRVGWVVRYDKPAYNESHFEPYFVFSKQKRAAGNAYDR